MNPQPKPTPRHILKGRVKRQKAKTTAEIRQYVFARERGLCRCCRFRRAETMHEIQSRGSGGKISKRNSIAVCGDGTRGCHGMLQQYDIHCWAPGDDLTRPDAESVLEFWPRLKKASDWMHIAPGAHLVSPPMQETEIAE